MTSQTPANGAPERGLPQRPSLDSLRKQAKKLLREAAAENADAIARVRTHLPRWTPPLTLRDAQLVLAREYGFTDVDGSRPDCWRYMVEVQDAGLAPDPTGYR